MGHCFNLAHIWQGSCGSSGDNVSDTPDQDNETWGCGNYPETDACTPASPGIMYMNYMDYSDDDCLNMFTLGQSNRMTGSMNTFYSSLYTSDGCLEPTSVNELSHFNFSVYPNPTSGQISIDMFTTRSLGTDVKVTVTDVMGKIVAEKDLYNPVGSVHHIDLSGNADGVYYVTIHNENFRKTERVTKR